MNSWGPDWCDDGLFQVATDDLLPKTRFFDVYYTLGSLLPDDFERKEALERRKKCDGASATAARPSSPEEVDDSGRQVALRELNRLRGRANGLFQTQIVSAIGSARRFVQGQPRGEVLGAQAKWPWDSWFVSWGKACYVAVLTRSSGWKFFGPHSYAVPVDSM